MQLERLEGAIDYRFDDRGLLERALSHRSVGRRNNERLEFLGDSALNHHVAERLFHRFPDADEGELSRMRAALVRGDTLAVVARRLGLGDHLRLGPGERKSGGRRRASILADALEALVGAVLIDGGPDACAALVDRLLGGDLAALEDAGASKDAKTQLQEHLQGRGLPLPSYELVSVEGSEHAREFEVACRLEAPACEARGSGSSRRRAEQAAARAVLEALADG